MLPVIVDAATLEICEEVHDPDVIPCSSCDVTMTPVIWVALTVLICVLWIEPVLWVALIVPI